MIVVTINDQQRVSGYIAMMKLGKVRAEEMIEFDRIEVIFTRPNEKRGDDYVTRRFGVP